MKKYRKGNSYKLDLINMKDLDYSLNGSDNEKEYFKTLKVIEHKLESLILIIERSRIREYMMLTDSKRRLFLINFVVVYNIFFINMYK